MIFNKENKVVFFISWIFKLQFPEKNWGIFDGEKKIVKMLRFDSSFLTTLVSRENMSNLYNKYFQ